MDSVRWDKLGDAAWLLLGMREAPDGRKCKTYMPDTLFMDAESTLLPNTGPPVAPGAGAALWLNSTGDGEVVSRTGTLALLRRFTEKVYSLTKEVATKGPVAVGITRMGTRVTFRMDELQRMLAALVTSGAGTVPPECRDLVLLQSTGKRFLRMVAADVSLEATPAGSHVVVRCRDVKLVNATGMGEAPEDPDAGKSGHSRITGGAREPVKNTAMRVVAHIEASQKCRISKATLYFGVDPSASSVFWLTGIARLTLAPTSPSLLPARLLAYNSIEIAASLSQAAEEELAMTTGASNNNMLGTLEAAGDAARAVSTGGSRPNSMPSHDDLVAAAANVNNAELERLQAQLALALSQLELVSAELSGTKGRETAANAALEQIKRRMTELQGDLLATAAERDRAMSSGGAGLEADSIDDALRQTIGGASAGGKRPSTPGRRDSFAGGDSKGDEAGGAGRSQSLSRLGRSGSSIIGASGGGSGTGFGGSTSAADGKPPMGPSGSSSSSSSSSAPSGITDSSQAELTTAKVTARTLQEEVMRLKDLLRAEASSRAELGVANASLVQRVAALTDALTHAAAASETGTVVGSRAAKAVAAALNAASSTHTIDISAALGQSPRKAKESSDEDGGEDGGEKKDRDEGKGRMKELFSRLADLEKNLAGERTGRLSAEAGMKAKDASLTSLMSDFRKALHETWRAGRESAYSAVKDALAEREVAVSAALAAARVAWFKEATAAGLNLGDGSKPSTADSKEGEDGFNGSVPPASSRAEIERLASDAEKKLASLAESASRREVELKEALARASSAYEERLTEQATLAAKAAAEAAGIRAELATRLAAAQSEAESHRTALMSARRDLDASLQREAAAAGAATSRGANDLDVRNAVNTAVAEMEERHRRDLSAAREAQDASLARLAEQYQGQMVAVLSDLKQRDEALAQLRAAAAAASERANVELALRTDAEGRLAAAVTSHAVKVAELESALQAAKTAMQEAQARLSTVASEAMSAVMAEVEGRVREETGRAVSELETKWSERLKRVQDDLSAATKARMTAISEAEAHKLDADTLRAEIGRLKEGYEARLSELRNTADRSAARAKEELEAAVEGARREFAASLEELRSRNAAAEAQWAVARSELEGALAQKQAEMAQSLAQRDTVALSAMEELRQQVLRRYTEDMEALRTSNEQERTALITAHEMALRQERDRAVADAEKRVQAAVSEAEKHAASLRDRMLEESLARARSELERSLADANAVHSADMASLSRSYETRVQDMRNAFAQEREARDKEVAGLRDALSNAVPRSTVEAMREEIENRAAQAVHDAVEAAVAKVRGESDAAIAALQAALRQSEANALALREKADAALQRSADALAEANRRAERAAMASEDAAAFTLQRTIPSALAVAVEGVRSEMAAVLAAQAEEAAKEMSAALTRAQQAHEEELRRIRVALEQDRANWDSERQGIQAELLETRRTLDKVSQDKADQATRHAHELQQMSEKHAQELASQAESLSSRWEAERAALENAAQNAIAAGIAEAAAATEAAKRAELEAARAEFTDKLVAAEREAAAERARAIEALELAHRQAMEAAFQSALADRDASVRRAMEEKQLALQELAERHRREMDARQQQYSSEMDRARMNFEAEKKALAEAAAADVAKALAATQAEMATALAAAENVWQQRMSSALQVKEMEMSAALSRLAASADMRLQATCQRYECALMAEEEARTRLLTSHAAAIREVVSRGIAEAEAETVAALGVFNAEWMARLEAKAQELTAVHNAEMQAFREQAEAELAETVKRMEAQRAAAVDAVLAEAAMEREALEQRHADALDAAIRSEREAAEGRLAAALAEAAAEKGRALAEAAARAMEERNAAIAAVREQANTEHEEAMDALRVESDRLLANIEGAMTKLKEERDAAKSTAAMCSQKTAVAEEKVRTMREQVAKLQRAGAAHRLMSLLLVGRYLQMLNAFKRQAQMEREQKLAEMLGEWRAKFAQIEESLQAEQERARSLLLLRAQLQETLTGFKRDTVLEHKVKTMELAQEIAGLADQQAELLKQQQALSGQLAELEGGVRAVEREMGELAKQGIISDDGTVNVTATRKKKRLDRDLDAALARMADRRTALEEVKRKMQAVEAQRAEKEEQLRAVEADLIATLVQQQRALMAILTAATIPPGSFDASTVLPAALSTMNASKLEQTASGQQPPSPTQQQGPTHQFAATAASIGMDVPGMKKSAQIGKHGFDSGSQGQQQQQQQQQQQAWESKERDEENSRPGAGGSNNYNNASQQSAKLNASSSKAGGGGGGGGGGGSALPTPVGGGGGGGKAASTPGGNAANRGFGGNAQASAAAAYGGGAAAAGGGGKTPGGPSSRDPIANLQPGINLKQQQQSSSSASAAGGAKTPTAAGGAGAGAGPASRRQASGTPTQEQGNFFTVPAGGGGGGGGRAGGGAPTGGSKTPGSTRNIDVVGSRRVLESPSGGGYGGPGSGGPGGGNGEQVLDYAEGYNPDSGAGGGPGGFGGPGGGPGGKPPAGPSAANAAGRLQQQQQSASSYGDEDDRISDDGIEVR